MAAAAAVAWWMKQSADPQARTRQPPRMLTYDNMGQPSYTLRGQVDVAVDCINVN